MPWWQGGCTTSQKSSHTQPKKRYLPFKFEIPLPKYNYTYVSTKTANPKPRRDFLNILIKIYLYNFPSIKNAHVRAFMFHISSYFPFSFTFDVISHVHFTFTINFHNQPNFTLGLQYFSSSPPPIHL